MTLTELLVDYYVPMRRISERTQILYALTISKWKEYLGREPTIDDLDELPVARFLSHRVRERAAATAAKDRAQIRALWEFAARRKLCQTWPTITHIRIPERVPEAWFSDEFQRLLDVASKERTIVCGIPGGLYWRALLRLCYESGERIGAVRDLRWSHVREGHVVFVAESRKGGRRDILREISPETQAAISAIRMGRSDDELVFPWECGRDYLWGRLKIILQRAGLPCGRKDKFHKIRRTTASYVEAAGLSAQQVLDHSDPKTTRKYLDPRIVKQKSAADVLPKVS